MNFKDLDLKPRYSSSEENLLEKLWIPLLANAVIYKRGVGYFRSDYLTYAVRGLLKFVENGGKAQMICGVEFTYDDIKTIEHSYEKRNEIMELTRMYKSNTDEDSNFSVGYYDLNYNIPDPRRQ